MGGKVPKTPYCMDREGKKEFRDPKKKRPKRSTSPKRTGMCI